MPHPPQPARDKSGYLSEDTIAALTTAPGGAISMVRISGPGAFAAFERLSSESLSDKEPRKLFRARIRDSRGKALDEALAVRFNNPSSFTGEDSVEIHLHGGSFISMRALESLQELGVRQALPGEFSFRAVRNGKMALTEAEAVADLIGASNDEAVSLALEKMSGSQNRLITGVAADLRQLAMMGEVGIDFADQDVDEVSLSNLKKRLGPLVDALQSLNSSYERGSRIQEGVRVAFIGLPNAGKSSFFNSLLGEDRSIVSEVAGTTRDVVRERLTLQGRKTAVTLRVEDTAGLRNSSDRVETMGIERTLRAAREADLLLLVVDCASSDAANLPELTRQWEALGRPAARTLGILAQTDRLLQATDPKDTPAANLLASFGVVDTIPTSAWTGAGVHDAAQAIAAFCENRTQRGTGEVLLTRMDHLEAVKSALEHVSRAGEASEIDLFAADLKHALGALSPLIGETLPEDILGQIFSKFCIGK